MMSDNSECRGLSDIIIENRFYLVSIHKISSISIRSSLSAEPSISSQLRFIRSQFIQTESLHLSTHHLYLHHIEGIILARLKIQTNSDIANAFTNSIKNSFKFHRFLLTTKHPYSTHINS